MADANEPFDLITGKSLEPWAQDMRTPTPSIVTGSDERAREVVRYRHVKRGTVYTVVGEAELQTATGALVDGSALVVYRGEDGKLWAREEGEFHDGRFEALAASRPTDAGAGEVERDDADRANGIGQDELVAGLKRALQHPAGDHDGWTDAGMEDAFFRWPVIVNALNEALATPKPPVDEAMREENRLLRVALNDIDVIAGTTIPPDGDAAAWAALDAIIALIHPFRTNGEHPPRNLTGDGAGA